MLIIISFFYTFALVGSYGYFRYSGIMPNFFVFSFMFQEPYNSWTLFEAGLSFFSLALFVIVFLIFYFSLRSITRGEKFRFFRWVYSSVILVVVLLNFFFHNNARFHDQMYVADTNAVVFINRNVYNLLTGDRLGSAGLQSRNKPKLETQTNTRKLNVLLIVAESLRRKSMGLYGYTRDTTPYLDRWFDSQNDGSKVLFKNGFSNSSSTLISVPSILSGISPDQPVSLTHSSPLFWEYGKAVNLSTFFISSHSFRWNNFEGFFKNAGIDYLWNKETSGNPTFNDIGIDDRKTVNEFKKHVSLLKQEGHSFAGVLHFNTNHFPYFIPSGADFLPVGSDILAPYDNSVRHLDTLVGDVLDFLEKENLKENTLVIFTSDHGETIFEHGYIGHVESNHIETVSIPMFFYIPKQLRTQTRDQILKINRDRNVANIDIIPTIIDFLGLGERKDIIPYRAKLEGKSLLTAIPQDRTIFIANNNETSLYRVGLSFVYKNLHYMLRLNKTSPTEELYDYTKDKNETNDLWKDLSNEKRKEYRSLLKDCNLCSDLYSTADISL
ncbi:sulfatase-like hydrolase/transferase [Leptospira sp. 'Mane']|uniref:sulfatase-like hydrolase/transferase n=1 Tax=Leptospira sp. 'Mane' TaxID=3387407 RepID=UPI00398A60AB